LERELPWNEECSRGACADVLERATDLDPHGLVDVVADSLDFAGLGREDGHQGPGLPQRLQVPLVRIPQDVGGKNGYTETAQFRHNASPWR
jgi:hypothetical protein